MVWRTVGIHCGWRVRDARDDSGIPKVPHGGVEQLVLVADERERHVRQCSQPVRVLDQDILDAVAVAADLQAAVVRHAQRRVHDRVVVPKQRRRRNLRPKIR